MTYFPVALDLRGRRCLVVGGGQVAERKLEGLLAAGADDIVVVAPTIAPGIVVNANGGVEMIRRVFCPEDLEGAFVVMVATDDRAANARVAAEARARRVLVNVADDPEHCDFILPAVVRRGEVQIAITTGALSPALARHLRERLETLVPSEYGALAEILAHIRAELHQRGLRAEPDSWQEAIDDEVLALLRAGDREGAERLVRERLGPATEEPRPVGRGLVLRRPLNQGPGGSVPASAGPPGRIVLVGAGPGDPALITVAGRRAIAEADVVVYDRLVNPCLLEASRHNAKIIYAGKRAGEDGPFTQEEINELLCAEARSGRVVVRLKGGDPFVFGRGGEEALAAARAGIPFTVIPGVTAATAVPAFAGIPVTHRGMASAFTVVTGQSEQGIGAIDWEALARIGGTLVLLMGVETLPEISSRLMRAGLPAETPAVVVQDGTTPAQRVVLGTLNDIAERTRDAGLGAPATAVIGEVAALAQELAWYPGAMNPPTLLADDSVTH